MRIDISSKVQACLLGVQLGDALGMPVETMKHANIMLLNEGRGICDFVDPIQRKIPEMAALKAGDTTDDWQLTAVIADSILEARGWNREGCAEMHVCALEESLFGWGKTTENAIKVIRNKTRDLNEKPAELGSNKGCGNGIMMKIAPIAIYKAMSNLKHRPAPDLDHLCMDLSFITHPDPRAGISAYAVALIIKEALEAEKMLTERDAKQLLRKVIYKVQELEWKYKYFRYNPDTVSGRLIKIFPVLGNADAIREEIGCGFSAMDTVGFTIATFLSHPTDFWTGVLEAVNAGGDTDTHGSIVGAMIGANCGLGIIPKGWREFREEFEESAFLGRLLADL